MSRATRTARGVAGAFISTVLAAVSHSIAGDAVTPAAVIVTAVIALPLCVALAGRIGSIWRAAIAVGLSQFLFHWTFVGLGAASTVAASASANTAEAAYLAQHAAHLGTIERLSPAMAAAGGADSVMWIMHTIAAVVTVALVLYGERAALALVHTIGRALPQPFVLVAIHTPIFLAKVRERASLSDQLLSHSPLSRRGPPILSA